MALTEKKYDELRKREQEYRKKDKLTAFYAKLRVDLSTEDYNDFLERSILEGAIKPGTLRGIKRP